MKLTPKNLYIREHGLGYSVHIEMPDGSRNFLHNEPMKLEKAIMVMHDFDGDTELNESNTFIIEETKYYRITVKLEDGRGEEQFFHSRKLNLNDVVEEYTMLIMPTGD